MRGQLGLIKSNLQLLPNKFIFKISLKIEKLMVTFINLGIPLKISLPTVRCKNVAIALEIPAILDIGQKPSQVILVIFLHRK